MPFKGPAGHYAMDGGTVLFSADDRDVTGSPTPYTLHRRDQPADEAHIDEMVSHANGSMAERVTAGLSFQDHFAAKRSPT